MEDLYQCGLYLSPGYWTRYLLHVLMPWSDGAPRHKLNPTSAPVSKISAWRSANPGLFDPASSPEPSSPEPGIVEQRKSLGGATAHLNDLRFFAISREDPHPPPPHMT